MKGAAAGPRMDVMRGAPGRHVQVTVGYGLWRQINEMSALLRSDDDDQDEGHRERNDRIWVGLSAMWRGHRFPDRCSSSMAFGVAGDRSEEHTSELQSPKDLV